MSATSTLRVVKPADGFKRISLDLEEVNRIVLNLRSHGYHVQQFGSDGWDCEDGGEQIFRATRLEANATRFHVRALASLFTS